MPYRMSSLYNLPFIKGHRKRAFHKLSLFAFEIENMFGRDCIIFKQWRHSTETPIDLKPIYFTQYYCLFPHCCSPIV